MGLEKPSLASCLSRRTNWLCHPVFTLTTHCGGVCVATVGGSGGGVEGASEPQGCGLCQGHRHPGAAALLRI